MFKIRKYQFKNHPVLGNLTLDFCGPDNKAVDTVIFAGENGTGKSTILDELYNIATHNIEGEKEFELETDNEILLIRFYLRKVDDRGKTLMYVSDGKGLNAPLYQQDFLHKYNFNGIFSDVDINFHSNVINAVTSLELDKETNSRRSSMDLPTHINQLLIDIQALDDAAVGIEFRKPENANLKISELHVEQRMLRFTTAFNRMFEGLSYSHLVNKDNRKIILFSKNGEYIPIDKLSSGEKQIVYRGCFLLEDVNALKGVFVFIDEPEISLHPVWQKKILDYYKDIFTDENGNQTSQLFVATHSPFIIHNENRRNDKVIVLARDSDGNIIVKDQPEYYKCNSVEVVQDAFYIHDFTPDQQTVYLEGRTDEKYFNKALEVYGLKVPFQFKWVGYFDDKGEETNTGKDAVNKAFQFLAGRNFNYKNGCILDCDTNSNYVVKNNVVKYSIPKYKNDKEITAGIENALVFGDFDIDKYIVSKPKKNTFGKDNIIFEFDKMKCCEAVCMLSKEELQKVFVNLKCVIDKLRDFFEDKVRESN